MFLRVALGVFTLAVCALCQKADSQGCGSPADILKIQAACKKENEDLLIAEGDVNKMEVCRAYPVALKCSVRAVPRCYDYIEGMFILYTHSPNSCQLTTDDIKELQEIVHKGTQVTELPAPTTTTTTTKMTAATSAVAGEQSGTTFLNILPSSTFSGSQKVLGDHQTQVHTGNKERREGLNMHDDGRAVMSNIPTMAVLLLMTPLLRWLTS